MLGERVGNYVITQLLGEGGMGQVYLAEHPQIGKKVALKVLHSELSSNEDIVTRFFHEAKAVNDIGHPNIVDIQDFGTVASAQGPLVYLVMELLTGKTLTNVLTNQKASFYAKSPASPGVNGQTEAVVPGIAAATDVTMTLPPPAGLTGPVNNATGVTTSTPFEFTTSASQVYRVNLESSTAIYVIYSTSGSLTIPAIPEMNLPASTSFTWQVLGYGPLANIDTAADTTALRSVSRFESAGAWHSYTTSPVRNFTTQ